MRLHDLGRLFDIRGLRQLRGAHIVRGYINVGLVAGANPTLQSVFQASVAHSGTGGGAGAARELAGLEA